MGKRATESEEPLLRDARDIHVGSAANLMIAVELLALGGSSVSAHDLNAPIAKVLLHVRKRSQQTWVHRTSPMSLSRAEETVGASKRREIHTRLCKPSNPQFLFAVNAVEPEGIPMRPSAREEEEQQSEKCVLPSHQA
tara:strand:+ start:1600 stop:2013 length:414 start_codon:yes stop_codon:yes gene_type:complete